jgi:hypothetical protein
MTAHTVDDRDPDDPVEILRVLPSEYHRQFLEEYDDAVAGAQRPEGFQDLHDMLRLWRLRATAYSDPSYSVRLAEALRGDPADLVPAEQIIPG